jgi:predicted glutamine amidotransferase
MFALNYLIDLAEVEYEEPIQIPEILKSSEAIGSFTSINNNREPQSLKITPNPAKDFIMIEYELEPTTKASIEIHDVAGKPVYSMQISNSSDKITLDTQTWDTGMYVATLKINGKVKQTIKLSISY